MAEGVKELVGPGLGVLLITHYQRMLNYITPDHRSRDDRRAYREVRRPELAHELEEKGYEGVRRSSSSGSGRQARSTRGGIDERAISGYVGRRGGFGAISRSFARRCGEHPLVYLDSAATSQKPDQVIDAEADFYRHHNANAHRGSTCSARRRPKPTKALAPPWLASWAHRSPRRSCSPGVTESLNLVAQGWGRSFLREGDEILITEMEHHSNIVPWQMTAR